MYLRDLCTEDGVSRVVSRQAPSLSAEPVAAGRTVSDLVDMRSASIKVYAANWEQRGRPAPQMQFVIVLSGRMEVEVPDGKTEVVGPGNILLCRDVSSATGHVTRFPVRSSIMTVQVDPAFDLDAWLGLSDEQAPVISLT